MKCLKYFGLFFLYPVCLLGTGFFCGAASMRYFYPGKYMIGETRTEDEQLKYSEEIAVAENAYDPNTTDFDDDIGAGPADSVSVRHQEEINDTDKENMEAASLEVMSDDQTLNADTIYVLEEADLRNDSVVETTWKLPAKYIGMNREEFLEAMDSYRASPPLEELERGFVGLEVLSFSKEKLVVKMNYEYVQPSNGFYLVVENHYVVVYLEDRKTVYMDTDILLKDLPEELQQDIIHVMFIPDEGSLYDFLENYSS